MSNTNQFTPGQARMLCALETWMESFFCNDSENRDDGMIMALDNGFTVHAVDCMNGTGATDKRFARIFTRLVNSVGPKQWEAINRQEAKELCQWARIQICEECNHNAFTDPTDEPCSHCSSCLRPLKQEVA